MRTELSVALLLLVSVASAMVWVFWVDPAACNGCGLCVNVCPDDAIYMYAGNAVIDPDLCTACGICAQVCPRDAIERIWYQGIEGSGSTGFCNVSPNPTSGPITVSGIQQGTEVIVVSICGRISARTTADSEGCAWFQLSDLPGGLYLVMAGTEEPLGSITLIKQPAVR